MSTQDLQEISHQDPWDDLDAFIEQPRLAGLELSCDGRWLLASVDHLSQDRTAWRRSLWRVDPTGAQPARRLTRGLDGEVLAAFLPNGDVLFGGRRPLPVVPAPDDHERGLWRLPADGGEAQLVVRGVESARTVLSARGSEQVVLGLGVARSANNLAADATWRAERSRAKVAAILHESAAVRHWDHDLPAEQVRFALCPLPDPDGEATSVAELDLFSPWLGDGLSADAVLSRDGRFVVCVDEQAGPRAQRRGRILRIQVDDGTVESLLDQQDCEFGSPVLSQDDRWLACVRHVPGDAHEAPHQYLHLLDTTTGDHRDLAPEWPRWGTPVGFSPAGDVLYVVADEDGDAPVFAVDTATGGVRRLTGPGAHSAVSISPDGAYLYALRSSWVEAGSIVRISATTGESTVLHRPAPQVPLPGKLERISTTAADGQQIHSWLAVPHEATAERPVPLVLWAHGGPLNSWNAWSWRWCPWLLVSQGWAVLLPDPALSTGYGRNFIQRGWGRWGEEPFTDLMTATDAALERDELDEGRTAMMGGSFGGYMANWIAGHTDRFRCIVSHASLWNLDSFLAATDHPWYWEREMTVQMRSEHSPHLFADAIHTPMLVIHGDKDHRVPIGEGLALWWALNRGHDGAPEELAHKFLYFPDENHWVLTPQHARIWYATVRSFLAQHMEGRAFIRPGLV
ncbi:alpha/beta fold hydrolase [Luteococcus sp. Sow4_B9]|uniref:alpha/beta fold hydrolase n=1 Tax=Luteococcus sp. Sow4_B9 TaxID=3438792 RepID=UPI003F9C68CC